MKRSRKCFFIRKLEKRLKILKLSIVNFAWMRWINMIIYIICENVDFHLLSISGINYVHKQEVFASKEKTKSVFNGKFVDFFRASFFCKILQWLQSCNVRLLWYCIGCHYPPVTKNIMIDSYFNLLFTINHNKLYVFESHLWYNLHFP